MIHDDYLTAGRKFVYDLPDFFFLLLSGYRLKLLHIFSMIVIFMQILVTKKTVTLYDVLAHAEQTLIPLVKTRFEDGFALAAIVTNAQNPLD